MNQSADFDVQKAAKAVWKYVTLSGGRKQIPVERILYAESRLHKVIYHVIETTGKEQEYSVYGKLSDVLQNLDEQMFCRTHQSYLVNMRYVTDIKRYDVTLTTGAVVQVSKRYFKSVEERFIRANNPI